MARDIYTEVTEMILAKLEEGEVPWRKPWTVGVGSGMWPANLMTGRKYSGINVCILALRGFSSPYWLTYNQARALGGHVRKGERSTMVIFWKFIERDVEGEDGDEAKTERIPYLRAYNVFNAEQCEGLKRLAPAGLPEPGAAEERDFDPIAACEAIVAGYKGAPEIAHDGNNSAYYRPLTDSVHMPHRERFTGEAEYYSTLYHELVHSTGAKHRLGRDGVLGSNGFGSENYSEEELVAEFGAAMLCGVTGIAPTTIDNSAAYIQHWASRIRGDRKLVVIAAARAQKAVDHILGE